MIHGSAATSHITTSRSAAGLRPQTAPGCRCRSYGRRTFRSTARRRRCSTATGRTRHRWIPRFSISRLSLLDRGIVYAIAHVRGGGELGRTWYEQGKKLAKKNTFTDFIACADYLIERAYTSPTRLAARGGSAGGLLMGAVANLAPERFRAIHAAVPFVDALTTILNPELPLTVIEWEEWGDPLHDPEVYAYMKSYTPYENVRAARLSGHPGDHQPQRHPRFLRRTGQMDRCSAASRNQLCGTADPAQNRNGGRPRRGERTLQELARAGFRVRLDHGRDNQRRVSRPPECRSLLSVLQQ